MIRVFSHPRSGTNYLAALIKENFYPDVDLSKSKQLGVVGHWNNRATVKPSEHGRLFGGHGKPTRYKLLPQDVYIYRDGRDVALSVWQSKHFMNKEWEGISFSEFIHRPLDWIHSPGTKYNNTMTIFEHWHYHLSEWENSSVYFVRYEKLTKNPMVVIRQLAKNFGIKLATYNPVNDLVGWFPNSGTCARWKDVMTDSDVDFFFSVVGNDFYGVYK